MLPSSARYDLFARHAFSIGRAHATSQTAAAETLASCLVSSAPDGIRPPFSEQAGSRGEDRALKILSAQGLSLLGRNLSCPLGEIDLIMRDGDVLVFVEVRVRSSSRYGGAAASIGSAKRRRLRHAAYVFLPWLARQYWQGAEPRCRFDVVALEPDGARWLRGVLEGDE